MGVFLLVKMVHVLSAAVLFGTGLGIANFLFRGQGAQDFAARHFAARMTVEADLWFTLPAVIVQPLTGAWMVWRMGYDWTDYWLVVTYGLYALCGLCWVPVVFLQIRMKQLLDVQAAGGAFDGIAYARAYRLWFLLGWPAFGAVIGIFWLMLTKPSW